MNTLKKLTASLIALACVVLFSTPAFSQSTPQLTDPEIASVAVTANQIDVNYGKLALKKSKNPAIRKFAQTMINDHSNIIKQAAALANKLGVTPKDNGMTQALLKGEKATMAKLKNADGKDFDKAYIDNEVAYHKAVISAVKKVLVPQTDNKQLKDFLVSAGPLLESHLRMAEMTQQRME